MRGETDDLYFMASDARIATEFAVRNNNPQNFRPLTEASPEQFEQENFSARNVNPEYIARYQADTNTADDGTVYFDDNQQLANDQNANINVYNNFTSNPGGNFNSFGGPFMNPMMMGGFSPWGMGMGMWDPFWGGGFGMMPGMGFGMRPGFNMSIGLGFGFNSGFGWGNPWMRPGFGWGGGFYDPFWPGMGFGFNRWGMGGFGAPGFGWGGFGMPVYILPGNEFGNRQIVRGARPTRGSSLATDGGRSRNVATAPSTSRAAARRDATSSRGISPTNATSTRNARTDFGSSQNDYYNNSRSRTAANTRSAVPSNRNTGSAVMNRGSNRVGSTSATPSYRTVTPNTRNTRSTMGQPSRTSSPSYNRNANPSYNNRVTPTRSTTPTRTAPSRSTYSPPSRSTGGSMSSGSMGGSRGGGGATSSGGSRGGRGN